MVPDRLSPKIPGARRDILALAGLTLFVPALFARLVLSNRVLASGDVWTYFTPYRDYAAAVLRSGHLPLWDPYLFLGVPFLANIQAAVLYPLHLPFLWLSTPRAIVWSIVLHAWLGGLFTYGWARRGLGVRALPALTAALVFTGSGFLGGHVGQLNQLNAYIWFPGLLWVWDATVRPQGSRRRRVRGSILLGVMLALQLLAGHTQAWYISVCGLGLYAVLRGLEGVQIEWQVRRLVWPDAAPRTLRLSLLILGGALLLGLGLAAAQLLPALELSSLSPRAGGLSYREVVSFSLRPQHVLDALLPAYAENLAARFGSDAYAEYVGYIGVSGLILAAWGARHADPNRRPLLGLALAGLLLAFGAYNPLYYVAYKLVPGWDLFRAPARWLLLYTTGLAGLAAFGLEQLGRRAEAEFRARRLGRRGRVAVGLLGVLVLGAALWITRPAAVTLAVWLSVSLVTLAMLRVTPQQPTPPGSPHASRFTFHASRAILQQLTPLLLLFLLTAELLAASLTLPHTHPTAPEAVTSLRSAPAYLLSATGLGRFLSMSGITYDPGDREELAQLFAGRLDEPALYDLIVAAKQKEIVAPNLPLLWRLQSVDGYDGGLLPLTRYVDLQRLLVPADQLVPDGRLREQLKQVPRLALLNLLNTRFVITDKVFDVWVDNVYYDLQFEAPLAHGQVWQQTLRPGQQFDATGLGIMSHLQNAASLVDGSAVARVRVEAQDAPAQEFVLHAGVDTAEGSWHAGAVAHRQARVGHPWRDFADGQDYLSVLGLAQPSLVTRVTVTATLPVGQFNLEGISLIDARTGTGRALVTPGRGMFERVHSGDVKIYENLDLLPRAYTMTLSQVHYVATAQDALAALQDPTFDPAREVVLEAPGVTNPTLPVPDTAPAATQVVAYSAEQVTISTTLAAPGILVLADAGYPGWEARVDGRPVPILAANLLFRGVQLPAGGHQVEFRFVPLSFRRGMWISLAFALAALSLLAATWLKQPVWVYVNLGANKRD